MKQIPLILLLAALSQALPALAALRYGRALPAARWWVVAWSLLLLTGDAVSLRMALQGTRNLWTGYVLAPLEVGLALFGLALWHTGVLRRTIRAAVPVFLIVVLALVLSVENTDEFSKISDPLKAALILAACVATLLARIRTEEGSLLRADWFWISIGLSLRYGCAIGIGPLSSLLVDQFPDTVASAWKIQSTVDLLASVVIAGGILCPIPPRRLSSGPSSPAASPSRSFSPHSALPW